MKLKFFFVLIWLIWHGLVSADTELPINKIVIWGYKLHSHTHSYIHEGYFKAFKHLGYKTYWFDSNDKIDGFDFSRSLFFTEGNCDKEIPIREDCFYVLHNCFSKKYEQLYAIGHCVTLQMYWNSLKDSEAIHIDEFSFYNIKKRTICMPWATNLLPHEIDEVKKNIPTLKKPYAYFVGSRHGDSNNTAGVLDSFGRACAENGIKFVVTGLYSTRTKITDDQHKQLIETSMLAPALQGKLQVDSGYIPCRIFKNISYGQLGVTNSKTVYEFFKKKIVYNPDSYRLCYDALARLKSITPDEIYEMMDYVRDNHTYVNRVNVLLNVMNMVYQDVY